MGVWEVWGVWGVWGDGGKFQLFSHILFLNLLTPLPKTLTFAEIPLRGSIEVEGKVRIDQKLKTQTTLDFSFFLLPSSFFLLLYHL
ncbi:MAG: hypothetical protein F6K23_26430 [Okeania sp. SIO2C9]|uniref:hypothetical protein n=1 Tax=Okeania sp. SIO2C9 TaxID=2607791 RepID=UPI0013C089CE|nr:hypothetical protein [Okeania sp. SIO2C9]NEQ76266.1 hypothetical protein [Okeania sp. SIO2C9]